MRNIKINLSLSILILIFCSLACNYFNRPKPPAATNENASAPPTATPSASPTATPADAAANPPGETEKNLMALANGTILVKKPKESNIRPYNLIEETQGSLSIWASRGTGEQVFVFELPEKSTFEAFSFDNHEHYYAADTSAKDVAIELSDTSASEGFQPALTATLENTKPNQRFKSTNQNPARWVRLTVKNNYGNADYIELGEIRGFGKQLSQSSLPNLNGSYAMVNEDESLSYEDLDLHAKQEGTTILGCDNESTFNGGLENRLVKLQWQQKGEKANNDGVLTASADGNRIVIAKFQNGGLLKVVEFQKRNANIGNCAEIAGYTKENATRSEIKDNLEKEGRARVYGINFDFNSEIIKEESKPTLNQVAAILKEKPDWRMTIEGHTDNVGGESFNQALSERRAKSVRDFLVKAGIEDARLESVGLGLSKPVAPNETEIGRAQNRRVELVKKQ